MNLLAFLEKFNTEEKCYAYLAQLKGTIYCRKCGRDMYKLYERREYQCRNYKCYAQQSLTAGTIFHGSTTPLQKWFVAIHLISNSKKGISACQLQREIKVTYKTAFRMLHQVRVLMKDKTPLFEGISEIDETYVGGVRKRRLGEKGPGLKYKSMVMGIVNRDTGKVHAEVGKKATAAILEEFILKHAKKESRICSDERMGYNSLYLYYKHDTVNHSQFEWARGDIYTNTIEGFWSLLKRGIKGIYHQASKHRLQSYVDEFVFRYNHRKSFSLFDILLDKV